MQDDLRQHLQSVVQRVRRRLALRRVVLGASRGGLLGGVLSLPVVALATQVAPVGQVYWVGIAGSLVVVSICTVAGVSWQMLQRGLQRTEVAQLLDRALGTEEAWVTATWLVNDTEIPRREELLADLQTQLDSPALASILAVRPPRILRYAPVLAAAWLALFFLPRSLDGRSSPFDGPVAAEAERLAERLREVEDVSKGAPLPDAVEVGLDALADELAGEELSADEAVERIEDLQQKLDAFVDELEPSTSLLEELERAAEELASKPDLAEALRDLDMDEAADQMDKLTDELQKMTPDEKEAIAQQMAAAGDELAGSDNDQLKKTGEAMKQAGQQMQSDAQAQRQRGSQNAAPEAGQEGSPAPTNAETQQRMDALREELQRSQELGQKLGDDQKALKRAQQTNGALEGSKQRMGGQADTQEGQSNQGADGQEDGEGEGQSEGQARNQGSGDGGKEGNDGQGQQAASTSSRHTWEDEGEREAGKDGFNDEDRNSNRTASADQHVDDFERLYAPSRLDDVDALLAGARGQVDEDGHIELVPTRRTTSDETAERGLIDVPEDYAAAAREAINDETVPPGYRDAVKQYFDQME